MKRTAVVFVLGVMLFFAGCGPDSGTETGNPVLVNLKFKPFNQTAMFSIFPEANAAVSELIFCFKRVRFKLKGLEDRDDGDGDPTNDSENQDFEIGEVSVSELGNFLGEISLAQGTYGRVEFDLEDSCPSGNSISVTNDNGGPFVTADRVSIRFDGELTIDENSTEFPLDVKQIVDALDAVTNDADIKDTAEGVQGVF